MIVLYTVFRSGRRCGVSAACLAFLLSLALAVPAAVQAAAPNIVFFLVDDLGSVDCGFAGGTEIKMPRIDGRDAWPMITAGARSPHEALLVATDPDRAALRMGDRKVIKDRRGKSELYNLAADVGEQRDLSEQAPEKRHALEATLAAAVPPAATSSPPNVIIFYADDLGWGDLGCQGNPEIPTPHIDSIAANGVRCTQGYVAATYCSPSRAGLLTGRYPTRFGHETNDDHDSSGFGGQTTLAMRLKECGYATTCIGKWHLGSSPERLPTVRGFDEFYGTRGNTAFYHPNKFIDSRKSPDIMMIHDKDFYTTDAYGARAVEWIKAHADRPWFLYLPFNAQHIPLQAPPKYLERFPGIADEKRRTFAAMLSAMDDAVGRVLATVREAGQEENTLVFFISDNGGPTRANTSTNGPLRGFKATTFEGGPRVPFLVQWKGRMPAGKTYDLPVMNLDVVPTVMAAAGKPVDAAERLDGVDLLPFLTGAARGRPHDQLYWRFVDQWAVRDGDWKLIVAQGGSGQPELYDLSTDIGERTDLAASQPDRVAAMQKLYDAWNAEQTAVRQSAERPTKKKVRRRERVR